MEESQISGLSDLSLLMQSNAALCPESQQTKKHLRHIIKIGISFTLIIFFPVGVVFKDENTVKVLNRNVQ